MDLFDRLRGRLPRDASGRRGAVRGACLVVGLLCATAATAQTQVPVQPPVQQAAKKPPAKAAAAVAAKKTAATAPKKSAATPLRKTVAVPMPQSRPGSRQAAPNMAAAKEAAPKPVATKTGSPPAAAADSFAQANVGLRGGIFAASASFRPMARPAAGPFAIAPTTTTSAADIALVRQVIDATRKGNEAIADVAERSITDPVARKLAEWIALRSDNTKPTFQRYANFIHANPSWPHAPLLRRRAEVALWNDKVDDATVRAFFAQQKPSTAKGYYMLAHALLAKGDRDGAASLVRFAWRHLDSSGDVERSVLDTYGSMLSMAAHKVRMNQRFYEDNADAGLRAAERLGGNEMAIARAWAAVIKKAGNAKALLDVLKGRPGAFRDVAILNAAAALIVAGKANDLKDGAALASKSIDSGEAEGRLDRLIAVSCATDGD